MDPEILRWVRAAHIYAFITWVGSLVGISFVLKAHAQASEAARAELTQLERSMALAMDIGATIAMVAGLYMLIAIKPSPLTSGGWMHAKLTLIVILLGCHGMQRVRIGRYRRGQVTPEPAWIIAVTEITVLGIVILAAVKPF